MMKDHNRQWRANWFALEAEAPAFKDVLSGKAESDRKTRDPGLFFLFVFLLAGLSEMCHALLRQMKTQASEVI